MPKTYGLIGSRVGVPASEWEDREGVYWGTIVKLGVDTSGRDCVGIKLDGGDLFYWPKMMVLSWLGQEQPAPNPKRQKVEPSSPASGRAVGESADSVAASLAPAEPIPNAASDENDRNDAAGVLPDIAGATHASAAHKRSGTTSQAESSPSPYGKQLKHVRRHASLQEQPSTAPNAQDPLVSGAGGGMADETARPLGLGADCPHFPRSRRDGCGEPQGALQTKTSTGALWHTDGRQQQQHQQQDEGLEQEVHGHPAEERSAEAHRSASDAEPASLLLLLSRHGSSRPGPSCCDGVDAAAAWPQNLQGPTQRPPPASALVVRPPPIDGLPVSQCVQTKGTGDCTSAGRTASTARGPGPLGKVPESDFEGPAKASGTGASPTAQRRLQWGAQAAGKGPLAAVQVRTEPAKTAPAAHQATVGVNTAAGVRSSATGARQRKPSTRVAAAVGASQVVSVRAVGSAGAAAATAAMEVGTELEVPQTGADAVAAGMPLGVVFY